MRLPVSVRQFVETTFSFFNQETHVLAAAFVYGCEAITASMFTPLVHRLEQTIRRELKTSIQPLLYYLNRHIELDGADPFPRAL